MPGTILAAAAGDAFMVRQLIGDDSNPPSTPVIETVIPVATSQIDVAWLPASDDIAVFGYRLYRDGVPVATTTQTSFSDTGLLASTTYSYTVDAYDFSFNVSTSSLAVATTTLSLPLPPPVATSTLSARNKQSASAVPALSEITITTTARTAIVYMSSYGPTAYTVRWGRTTSYELGSISTNVYKREHSPTIYQLEPGMMYYYEVELINSWGIKRQVESGVFKTAPGLSSNAPANVFGVVAQVDGDDVRLSWKLPTPLVGTVRVVRSHLFYPTTPTDGIIIFDGIAQQVTDSGALRDRAPQFYTIFVQSPDGRLSSGAVVLVNRVGVRVLAPPRTPASTDSRPEVITETGEAILLDPAAVLLQIGDVTTSFDALATLPAATAITILIPKVAVRPHLKAIILSVHDTTNHDEVTAYLLKLDASGRYYTVTFITPAYAGEAALSIAVYDFTAAVVRTIGLYVTYYEPKPEAGLLQERYYRIILGGSLGLSLFFLLFYFWWREVR